MFVVPSATFRLLFVTLILVHDRRKVVHFNVTRNPIAAWLSRQGTEAFPWDRAPRFLLRDRDGSYGSAFSERVEAMGIAEVKTAPRSPWQNAYAERIIGSYPSRIPGLRNRVQRVPSAPGVVSVR
jgi:transposase InsO family protein